MSREAYHLGELTDRGVRLPWYVPHQEAAMFAKHLQWKVKPPETTEEANEAVRNAFDLCRINPAFAAHEYARIRLGQSGTGPFNQWSPGQRKLHGFVQRLRAGRSPVRIIVLKARREGVSTYFQWLKVWRTAFFDHANGLTAAHEDEAAGTLFSMYRYFLDNLPDQLKVDAATRSSRNLTFEEPVGGSISYRSVALGGGTKERQGKGRSQAIHFMHASEAGFWNEPERFWTGAIQCVEDYPETYVGIESTANSYGWFYDMWAEASKGWTLRKSKATGKVEWVCTDPRASVSDLTPVFLSWLEESKYSIEFDSRADKEYLLKDLSPDEEALIEDFGATPEQLNWRRRTLHGSKFAGNLKDFQQEYPTSPDEAFKTSGRKVFDMGALDIVDRRIRGAEGLRETRWCFELDEDGPRRFDSDDGETAIWVEPTEDGEYAIGIDGSYGKDQGDWMCAQVLNVRTLEQVARIRMRLVEQEEFAEVCAAVGRYYNDAIAVVEVNGPGLAVIKAMERFPIGYENFYYRSAPDGDGRPTKSVGWWSSDKSRRWMVSELVKAVRKAPSGKGLILHDAMTIQEMKGWIYKRSVSGKVKEAPASAKGHDDLITSLGLALVGGAIESGYGQEIVSKKVGNRKASGLDPRIHDLAVADILAGQHSADGRFYHEILGANV